MAELNWTAEAEQWLCDIYAFIAKDRPAAASKTVGAIYQRAEILRQFPEIGHRYHQEPNHHPGPFLVSHSVTKPAYACFPSLHPPTQEATVARPS